MKKLLGLLIAVGATTSIAAGCSTNHSMVELAVKAKYALAEADACEAYYDISLKFLCEAEYEASKTLMLKDGIKTSLKMVEEKITETGDDYQLATAKVHVVQHDRNGNQTDFNYRYNWRLEKHDGKWRIRSEKVEVIL